MIRVWRYLIPILRQILLPYDIFVRDADGNIVFEAGFDENGKEYFRHTGYFPKEELVKILKMQGVE